MVSNHTSLFSGLVEVRLSNQYVCVVLAGHGVGVYVTDYKHHSPVYAGLVRVGT